MLSKKVSVLMPPCWRRIFEQAGFPAIATTSGGIAAASSVGNDPTWNDGGPEGRYRDYWQNYSFGDLNASAKTRKEVLQRLIPRLKISTVCTFEEKFLVVRGQLRTYKIHLGSGNKKHLFEALEKLYRKT